MSGLIKRRFEILRKIRWTARIVSVLFIVALIPIYFLDDGYNERNITSREWMGLVYFPIGVFAGLIIGWKNELIGGLISLLCVWFFYYFYAVKIGNQFPPSAAFLLFSIPAVLFLISGSYAYFAIGKLTTDAVKN